MDGVHPRKAGRGLAALAAEALRKRGMEPSAPSDAEIATAETVGGAKFERSRRLSLLEPMLGELIEICCTLDRTLALHEAGMRTRVFRSFVAGASDRNLAILAEPSRAGRSPSGSTACATLAPPQEGNPAGEVATQLQARLRARGIGIARQRRVGNGVAAPQRKLVSAARVAFKVMSKPVVALSLDRRPRLCVSARRFGLLVGHRSVAAAAAAAAQARTTTGAAAWAAAHTCLATTADPRTGRI